MNLKHPRPSPAKSPPNTASALVFAVLFSLAMFFAYQAPVFAAPSISQPNGIVHESAEDLRVKVLGGWVSIARTWAVENVATGGGKWYFNAAWADLQFTYDSLDGSVKSINRLDSQYDKGGNGVYIFYKQDFIKAITAPDPANPAKTIITGWRWYNTAGDWITYNKDGRITGYGDRNNIQVSFLAFAAGITLCLGTGYLLVFNGVLLGLVIGSKARRCAPQRFLLLTIRDARESRLE